MEVDDVAARATTPQRNNGRPPWVKFHWGTNIHTFKAIIKNLEVTFTYFSNEGLPLRANVEMSLEQFEPDANWARQNAWRATTIEGRSRQYVTWYSVTLRA